jgi:polysaccharide export outer membrane protein
VLPVFAGVAASEPIPAPLPDDFKTYVVGGQNTVADDEQMNFEDYLIGPSNLLEIKVAQDPQLARTLRVDSRGEITLPLIGSLRAAGLTARQLELLIAERLEKDFINNPDVMVFIREFTSLKIVIQGNVTRPGIYTMTGKPTLLESISMAGGLNERADPANVKLVRARMVRQADAVEKAEVYNIEAIKTARQEDPRLESGDNIFVEEATPIIIEGAVMRPGVIYPKSHTTLMQIISMAGGLRELGDGTSIKVYSPDGEGSKLQKTYNLDRIREGKDTDPVLKPGYVVVVEEAGGRALLYGVGRFFRSIIRFTPIPIN